MMQSENFSEIWERVKRVTKLTTFTELADLVGTTHQYVSRKNKKNEFPVNWAFIIAQQNGLSTDWIMTGKGLPKPGEQEKRKYKILDNVEEWMNEQEGTEPEKNILIKKAIEWRYPEFTEWLEKKTGKCKAA